MKDYFKIVSEKFQNKYELIYYFGYEEKSKIKCNRCNNIFDVKFHTFIRNKKYKCPFCESTSKDPTENQILYKLNIDDDFNKNYEIVKLNKKISDKSIFLHKQCGNKIELSISRFLSGKRCKYCQHRSFKFSDNEVDDIIKSICNDEYIRVSEYKGLDEKITLYHNECRNTYEVTFHNFKSGSRCPYCWRIKNRSRGESIISGFLLDNKIDFISEYSNEECKNKRLLKFDFYIPSKNIIIEFDGQQHFIPYDHFGGNFSKEKLYLNDTIKNKFCDDNKIRLIRIKYTNNKQKILDILKKFLIDENYDLSKTTKYDYYDSKLKNHDDYYRE